ALLHLRRLAPDFSEFTKRPHNLSYLRAIASGRSSNRRCSSVIMASVAKKVLVPVANGIEPLEAVVTIDVLRRSGAEVTVASVEKNLRVEACHGVKIVADALISD
ncbi:hypothetical protein M569_06037, partial [Genlisea aurea]